ncbi:type II toxin-antitoxin system RelE/ParE family toxin [Pelagicoccus sp. SDUM812002]|uniref:type II toxin-antitoxin system RelE/ParE family toxin n=1 Tax=Pelagicoccus sp. SDUM812002 TaxID=3041266 RepID=UPI00280C5E5E|nr:type II toxin-antitoxin system RelE/ParE family toxin [Pelagicoccus sp. SDUM812002]MDQ8188546.1 type II toxin-antitoxin system RelE/ParE family toxin [Pelagicoccus sp. SDUM812002]
MARDLYISEEAESDLDDIWDYIAKDSPLKADRFLEQLYRKCISISELDGIGRRRDELADGLLSIPHKKYIIFFVRDASQVNIVRILRGSRDLDQLFEEE